MRGAYFLIIIDRIWNQDCQDIQHLRARMHPNDGRVVSNFIVQALKGKDLTVYGTGKQTRLLLFRV